MLAVHTAACTKRFAIRLVLVVNLLNLSGQKPSECIELIGAVFSD